MWIAKGWSIWSMPKYEFITVLCRTTERDNITIDGVKVNPSDFILDGMFSFLRINTFKRYRIIESSKPIFVQVYAWQIKTGYAYVPPFKSNNVNSSPIKIPTSTGSDIKKQKQDNPTFKITNYPNPFGASSMSNNASTTIHYSLTKQSHVRLIVTNLLGQEIQTLVNDNVVAGEYSIQFNAKNLPTGLYFYRLETDKNVLVKKMMLIR